VNMVKCLKQVLRCASSLSFMIIWKCEWYMCAYTLNMRLKMVLTTSRKFGGKGVPGCIASQFRKKYMGSDRRYLNQRYSRTYEQHKLPIFCGKMDSSSSWASIQSIKYSTYLGAETSIGLLILTPSAHRYSYLCGVKVSFFIKTYGSHFLIKDPYNSTQHQFVVIKN
jgi:hypothetical protein